MGSPHGQGFGEPIGGLNEKTVGKTTPTRGLLADATAPEAAKTMWLYSIVTDPVYGGFSVNVVADFFVRIFLCIATYLVTYHYRRRARQRERIARYLESQRQLGQTLALRSILESMVVGSQGSPGIPPALQADNSTAQSSSTASPPVPENHAQTAGSIPAGSVPGSPTSSTNAVPTPTKRPYDQLRRRKLNGYTSSWRPPIKSRSMGHATSTSSESLPVATPWPDVAAHDHHVIDMTFSCRFPSLTDTTKKGDKFKETVKEKLGVAFDHDVCSSRTMQARVPATKENLDALRKVAVEGMKLDEKFTLQIGASFMYCCTGTPEEPVLLSLRDVEVPTVLQAEYSAGMLTVRGRHLEGAEIRASTSEGYMIFASVKQDPVDNEILPEERIETWRCTDLLPPVKLDQIQIFASKRVHIQGHSVTVRSELCSIQNTTLRTVIYKWVPTIIIMSTLASQLWAIWALLSKFLMDSLNPWFSYTTLALMMYIIQLLTPSLEENIGYFLERLKLAISSFHVFPKPLATPKFFMRDGFFFQRGAKYLIYPQPRPSPYHEGHYKRERTTIKIGDKKKKENLATNINWKWPHSGFNGKRGKFNHDSNDDASNFNDEIPFEVLYTEKSIWDTDTRIDRKNRFAKMRYLPKEITLKLYSKHLQNVVRDCFPNNMKQFENYGEIQAMELLIAYLHGNLPRGIYASRSNLPSTSDDDQEKNDLHMFHLKRFLEMEYGDTIKQYRRMMKVDVVSWDMLWTLIVPSIDVIYYCEISNQELCGKVSTINYEFERNLPGKFSVDLEVYDFDCNNFVSVNVVRELYFFKDDVKIINLDVFPLQCTTNPQESEEQLFHRGRIFCDLVLKHERQFMHYEGLIYETPRVYEEFEGPTYTEKGGHGIKANVDGRVMIDQKWFAKLKSRRNMGTAKASGWNPIHERPETRIRAIANEFDSVLKYSPAIAYGYSFSIRKWGCFNIIGFSKIHFVSTAFDKLVIKEESKLALLTFAEYYINNTRGINNAATHIDFLPNKGQGCVIVLHGPPGTGKTLTVESLAERLECPLWQLSISKLTASTKKLENKLLRTFEVAKSWGAILVLDEADIYLSSRTYSPIGLDNTPNNAMTGVFLRVLEHYKGILFLTTNVMERIESAIFSRISLFVKYEEFNREERKKLWSNFLEESRISDLSEDFWDQVLKVQFNGRVIRNIIQSAQIFIQSKSFGTETSEECVLRAFDAMTTPSTMHYLVGSHEADHSILEVVPTPEVAPTLEVAPSMGSAPAPSFTSD